MISYNLGKKILSNLYMERIDCVTLLNNPRIGNDWFFCYEYGSQDCMNLSIYACYKASRYHHSGMLD